MMHRKGEHIIKNVSVGDHNSICLLRLEFLYSHRSLEVNIMNILLVLCYFKDNKKQNSGMFSDFFLIK